ncbi:MAG: CIA30 family protein [Pseudomonadales bacterium]
MIKRVFTQALGVLFVMATLGSLDAQASSVGSRVTAHDLDWRVINDNVMGGRSLGGISRTDQLLSFSGALNTNGGGFASIRVAANDLLPTAASGVRLRVRGDGRAYTLRLRPWNSRISYWSQFATNDGEWLEVDLPFESFWPNWRGRRLNAPAITAADVAELGLMINDGIDGAFAIDVDWIAAY